MIDREGLGSFLRHRRESLQPEDVGLMRGQRRRSNGPGLLRILDRLTDTPAEIITEVGDTLRQTPLGSALFGDASQRTGPGRSIGHRWFTDPTARDAYPSDERERCHAAPGWFIHRGDLSAHRQA
jgi:hypothetical protein